MMPLSPYLEMFAEHLKYVEVTIDLSFLQQFNQF